MDTNRLSTLAIVMIAVCGGVTAVIIGLAACLCILRKRRSGRFLFFFFILHKRGLLVHECKHETDVAFFVHAYKSMGSAGT